jgi:hypothetical protein
VATQEPAWTEYEHLAGEAEARNVECGFLDPALRAQYPLEPQDPDDVDPPPSQQHDRDECVKGHPP